MCSAPAGPAPPASLTVLASAALWSQKALLCASASIGAVTWLARGRSPPLSKGVGSRGAYLYAVPMGIE